MPIFRTITRESDRTQSTMRFGLAFAAAIVALLFSVLGLRGIGFQQPLAMVFPAVVFVTLFAGFVPGVLCLAAYGLGALFVLYSPASSPVAANQEVIIEFTGFMAIALLLIIIADAFRRTRSRIDFKPPPLPRIQSTAKPAVPTRPDVQQDQPDSLAIAAPLQRSSGARKYERTPETSLSLLATGLGHDICNIVLPITCHLDSLAAQDLPAGAKQELNAVRKSVMHLRQLSSKLSLVAQDRDDENDTSAATSLHSWWIEVSPILMKSLPRHVILHCDLPQNLPLVKLHASLLTKAILNLMVNASEAMSNGSGTVWLWARAAADGESVEIGLTDNGRGMTDEVRHKAMNPFFTTKTRSLSTGLGLSQVNAIVQHAGGQVRIESTSPHGSVVIITLPIAQAPIMAPQSQPKVARIALADQRNAAYIRALLEGSGFQVNSNGRASDPDESLWITEPTDEELDNARQFLRNRHGRRVIVVGNASERWNQPGIVRVDSTHRAMHKALQAAAREMT